MVALTGFALKGHRDAESAYEKTEESAAIFQHAATCTIQTAPRDFQFGPESTRFPPPDRAKANPAGHGNPNALSNSRAMDGVCSEQVAVAAIGANSPLSPACPGSGHASQHVLGLSQKPSL